jgi:hypothetical protein
METPDIHHPPAPVVTVRYRWNGENRTRCFEIRDGEPVLGKCAESRFNQSQPGLGTVIEQGTKAVGIKPCGGCLKRKEALNAATPGWMKRILGKLGKL